jgi:hypothetical protein
MIEVSSIFESKAKDTNRNPQFEVNVDWDRNEVFQDETEFVMSIEIERNMSEPLGGVVLAQCDLTFVNSEGRMIPIEESQ